MKTVAYTALHYGKPYLGAAIQSVIDSVDEYIVLYSPTPSHNGGVASLPCPDSESDLYDIAKMAAGNKLKWVRGNWKYENQQRAAVHEHAPDAAMIFVLDSDEIWSWQAVESALRQKDIYTGIEVKVRQVRLPVLEFWRSFYRAFPDKLVWPTRIIYPKLPEGAAELGGAIRIFHFGYAQPVKYVAYKWSGGHGHQSQLRQDCDWVNDVYATNRQTDCHPTTPNHWNAKKVNPWFEGLPEFMRYHPYANLEVIE